MSCDRGRAAVRPRMTGEHAFGKQPKAAAARPLGLPWRPNSHTNNRRPRRTAARCPPNPGWVGAIIQKARQGQERSVPTLSAQRLCALGVGLVLGGLSDPHRAPDESSQARAGRFEGHAQRAAFKWLFSSALGGGWEGSALLALSYSAQYPSLPATCQAAVPRILSDVACSKVVNQNIGPPPTSSVARFRLASRFSPVVTVSTLRLRVP